MTVQHGGFAVLLSESTSENLGESGIVTFKRDSRRGLVIRKIFASRVLLKYNDLQAPKGDQASPH